MGHYLCGGESPKVPADRHSVVSSAARGIPAESSARPQAHAPGWHLLTVRTEEQWQSPHSLSMVSKCGLFFVIASPDPGELTEERSEEYLRRR